MAVYKRTYKTTCPKTGKPIRRKTKNYYGKLRDADSIVRRVKLCPDKAASETMLNDLKIKAYRKQAGLSDPFEEQRKRPLVEHIADFRRSLEADNNTPKHVRQTVARLEKLVAGCEFTHVPDLSASKAADWLAKQREPRRDELDGPAIEGMSVKTSNYYAAVAKQFGAWLVADGRCPHNAFARLAVLNTAVDVRRVRRAAASDEFSLLLGAARTGKPFRKLSGADREMLYLLAVYTGLRVAELASLTARSFDFDANPPTVTVAAAYSKRRRLDLQPIRPDLAEKLRDWLAVRVEVKRDSPLWPGTWYLRAARMLRRDLEAARKKWIEAEGIDPEERQRRGKSDALKAVNGAGSVLDFHGLRHTFISNLAASGVHPKEAQQLARHSTICLTMDRYTHLQMVNVTGALDKLPAMPSSTPATEAAITTLQATGTDGKSLAPVLAPTGPELARPDALALHSVSADDIEAGQECETPNSISWKELGAGGLSLAAGDINSGGGIRTPDTRIMIPLL